MKRAADRLRCGSDLMLNARNFVDRPWVFANDACAALMKMLADLSGKLVTTTTVNPRLVEMGSKSPC